MGEQFRQEAPVVVTNCTARKRSREQAVSSAGLQNVDSVRDLARRWVCLAQGHSSATRAADLYGGRSFRDAAVAAESCGADLFIVSAGFGLVSSKTALPNYALTVSQGAGSIAPKLKQFNASAADWWRALCGEIGGPEPVSRLVRQRPAAVVLLALPSSYLQMVAPELSNLSTHELSRLRLLTSLPGLSLLEPRVADCVLPYDDRLSGVRGHAGTRTDFPQRALRHFVEVLQGHQLSLQEGKTAVVRALSRHKAPTREARVRASDDEICSAIKSLSTSGNLSASTLLRRLRDEQGIACEQGRFRSLWQQVQQERVHVGVR